MVFQECRVHPVERPLDGQHLLHDIDAIGVVFDHALDAAHVAFDAAQARQDLLPLLSRTALHRCGLSLHGPSPLSRPRPGWSTRTQNPFLTPPPTGGGSLSEYPGEARSSRTG